MEASDLLLTTTAESLKLNHSAAAVSPIGAQQKDDCHQFRVVFYALFASIVGLLGLLGNALSFAILGQDRGSAVAAFQLRSLAVADSLFLLLWLVNYSLRIAVEAFHLPVGLHLGTVWLYVRLVTFPVLYVAQSGTIWLTVVVAFNRYVAVCLPYRAHLFGSMSLVRKQVVGVAVAAIVYNVPRFFELKAVDAGNGTITWNRTELGHSRVYRVVYTDTLYYLLTFIVPLVTLACMNTRVIVTYRETCRRRRGMTSRSSTTATDQEQSITLVMIVIVVVFLACQTPAKIVQMVWAYSFADCRQLRFYLIHVSNVLEVLNSSVNFVIYSAFYRHFRAILLSRTCCCRRPPGTAVNCETALDDNTVGDITGTSRSQELRCNYSIETVLLDAVASSSQSRM